MFGRQRQDSKIGKNEDCIEILDLWQVYQLLTFAFEVTETKWNKTGFKY